MSTKKKTTKRKTTKAKPKACRKKLHSRRSSTPRLGSPRRSAPTRGPGKRPDLDRRLMAAQTVDDAVRVLNERHFIIRVGTTYVVGEERPHEPLRLLPFEEFKKRYLPYRFQVSPRCWMPLGSLYVSRAARRLYDGDLVFRPPGCPEATGPQDYNVWTGLAVEPKVGDWSRLQAHLFENLCRRQETDYEYLLNWLALGVQQPGRLPGVAVCMHGAEGTGKSALFAWYSALFPRQHTVQITHPRHLTGHFNVLLSGRVVVFADEAYFAGDKAAIGALHGLITEPRLVVERKYIDPSEVNNCTHLMIASNHDWIVHASKHARRYFVLKVADTHKQDHAYFDAITAQQNHGGREAMLYDLLHRDLRAFNPLAVPKTEGLRDQIAWSLQPHEAWWKERLMEASTRTWQTEIGKKELHQDYIDWMRKLQRGYPITLEQLSKYLVSFYGAGILRRVRAGGRQQHVYALPPLGDCRQKFDPGESWPEEPTLPAQVLTMLRRKVTR